MAVHREKVLAHAERQLVREGKQTPADLLALYQKFLKIENHRLRLRHHAGGGGREIAGQRASLLDVVLSHLFEGARKSVAAGTDFADLALVAIGGYGRAELNPYSDVDIMFLHPDSRKGVSVTANEIIQQILYMLWDVGFKVGHSTRSVSGAVKQANADMLSKTSLLEARLVAGDAALFSEFEDVFEKKCVRGHEEEYIRQRAVNQTERHEKHGGTVFVQEPNVKTGVGGLRDYHNLLWVSYFKEGAHTTARLVELKLLQENERRALERAYDFLLRVRTELHYLNKRATDSLALSQQFQVATKFEYPQANMLRRGEAFMRDYYQHARSIYHATELLSERLSVDFTQPRPSALAKLLPRRRPVVEHFDGFYSENGKLYAEAKLSFTRDPHRLMRLFQHAQQRQLTLSPQIEQLVRRRTHLVDRTFQYARATRETFRAILSRKGEVGRILRMMHELDLLGRYLPEFGELTCLVQHEFFHRYTADEHTLVCIEKLDGLIDTETPRLRGYRELFQKLDNPFVLYLSLLLHDTGKAANARQHAEASALFAQRVAARLQLTPEERRQVIFLVDNHIFLSSTAQRRNVEDPATISEFANVVRNQSNLDALMLITLADGQGTGDENWSDWKESLIWTLYQATTQFFADGEAFYRQRKVELDELRTNVTKKLAKDYADEIDAHFELMPDRYFQTFAAPEIIGHLRLFRQFLQASVSGESTALLPAMKWIDYPEQGHSEVWVVTWDREQLLSKIAGGFSVAQLNILGADIYTRSDSLVLDIFRVCDTGFRAVEDEAARRKFEKTLGHALEESTFEFTPLLQKLGKRRGFQLSQEVDFPTRITVLNDVHPVYTVVDVQTPDRLALLHNMLRGFAEAGVNIALSRIATEKGAAIDSFYVTDSEGKKVRDTAAIQRLQEALLKATERSAKF